MNALSPIARPRLFVASGIFHPEPGGPATYLRELLPELQARGWDIRALTFSDSAEARGEPYQVTRIVRQSYPLRMTRYAAAARPLLAWADLVYVHLLGLPLIGDRHAKRVIKIVGDLAWERAVRRGWIAPTEDIDAYQTRRYGLATNADRARLAREARTYDGVIVPSEYLKRLVVGWGVLEDRVRVIYNALPPDLTAPDIAQADARAQLSLPEGPLVLTVGRVLPWKGVDHLIAALVQAPDVHLAVAGDGPALGAAQALAASSDVGRRVHFLGRVARDQMPLYMKAADYVALYSGYEGLSHTLLESLRVGTPVIASDKGGNPEVVQHGVNGLLVPYVNVDALAAALHEAFTPGRREALAAHHAAGMERFAYSRLIDQTDAALRGYL
ncbi:MAG TPA: glycosyltransferase family 4 protein [Candidatus Limnocylindrales bacterium]|nr:glycosyltransferase family 4 protein [Candidatus Limnocylindrales bacterium]